MNSILSILSYPTPCSVVHVRILRTGIGSSYMRLKWPTRSFSLSREMPAIAGGGARGGYPRPASPPNVLAWSSLGGGGRCSRAPKCPVLVNTPGRAGEACDRSNVRWPVITQVWEAHAKWCSG